MSCAVCATTVEKAVKNLDEVKSCSVNLLTGTLSVEGTATDKQIESAVVGAGYGIKTHRNKDNGEKTASETKKLALRLIFSCFLSVALMYFSMGVVMWHFPLPTALENPVIIALIQFALTISVVIINRKFFISGTKSVLKGSPNMDTLVSLGSGASLIYSIVVSVLLIVDYASGNGASSWAKLHSLYYESSAMILTLITVGKTLEAVAKGKTTSAISSLIALTPKSATILVDGQEKIVAIDEIKVGDEIVIKAGGTIACDGIIVGGNASINESALTGESIPVDKTVGDGVSCATTVTSGYIVVKAEKVGENTMISEIVKTVENANSQKAPIAKIADKISGIFVPGVLAIALVATIVWLIASGSISQAVSIGTSVLVISCPCALGLATPVAIMVGSGVGAKNGVLYKTAQSLELAGRIKIVALDKTGTLTLGKPEVTDIIAYGKNLNDLAYSLEKRSEHPLAVAITNALLGANEIEIKDFTTHIGNGVSASVGGGKVYGGSVKFISSIITLSENQTEQIQSLQSSGKTVTAFCQNDELVGIIALADKIKPDAKDCIEKLNELGIETVMLTGDDKTVASAVAGEVGIKKYYASVMPNQKSEIVQALKEQGKTAMVGDGINDAPALVSADLGIAIGTGKEIAIESAGVVLPGESLSGLVNAIKIGKLMLRNIKQNLFWAFLYNTLAIPLACGIFAPLGFTLSPMVGALAMSLSSVCVVGNALRINFYQAQTEKKRKEKNMEYTLKIEGMMCPHCQARVKTAIESVSGVTSVEVDYKKGTAVVVASADNKAQVIETVEKQGYKVI